MKVLKLKDPATFTAILTKRGNNVIIPAPDADGNFVLGLNILIDPVYADIVEDILDLSEAIEHKPLVLSDVEEKPPQQEKGEFAQILAGAKDLEEAVTLYYDSKKGLLAKGVDMVMSAGRAVVDFFTPST